MMGYRGLSFTARSNSTYLEIAHCSPDLPSSGIIWFQWLIDCRDAAQVLPGAKQKPEDDGNEATGLHLPCVFFVLLRDSLCSCPCTVSPNATTSKVSSKSREDY
ncbi:hypothetical protein SAY86_028686 [Trapa natans]|uniref:Uncharacterized protein n=1 Tax=Trapa natans TaxID=22666 RepID=A0AAN7MFV8_TRANT|nr:hypothetical protein SAY86_028686 [Trapa natans]